MKNFIISVIIIAILGFFGYQAWKAYEKGSPGASAMRDHSGAEEMLDE